MNGSQAYNRTPSGKGPGRKPFVNGKAPVYVAGPPPKKSTPEMGKKRKRRRRRKSRK